MAYRIRYGRLERRELGGARMVAAQTAAAVCLLALILAVRCWVPQGRAVCVEWFASPEEPAVEAMARVLARGGGFREGLVAMCRQILEAAGHGA